MSSPLLYGEFAPALRAGAAFVIVSCVMWGFRPSFAFTDDGEARRWVYNPPNVVGRSTAWPWWVPPTAAALVFGVLL